MLPDTERVQRRTVFAMGSKIRNSLLVLAVFALALYSSRNLLRIFELDVELLARISHTYAWYLIPPIIVTALLFGKAKVLSNLGLDDGFAKGFLLSLVFALPMLLGSFFTGTLTNELNVWQIVQKSLGAGFFEEFFYRGFLFGLLFRRCGWGFIPASLLGGLIFGALHIYQGNSFAQALAIFAITGMGGVWFAWLYIEWQVNLWVPIFLHTFMNLSWVLFDISDTGALGGYSANLFRVLTIALSVAMTIRFSRTKDYFRVNRSNLLVN